MTLTLSLAVTLCVSAAIAASGDGATKPATRPATTMAMASTAPTNFGPDVVMMRELVALYEPVPFDHRSHARMAEMWDGCVTCHHRTPQAATQPSTAPVATHASIAINVAPTGATQEQAAAVPLCKHCHPLAEAKADIHMPSLKGAYHRQCLNCHREWSGANDCVICHKPRDPASIVSGLVAGGAARPDPTRDDIVGRMHPPIPAPDERLYVARFTPADGGNVLFRHNEHANAFGLKCVSCHRHDNCSHCHDPKLSDPKTRPSVPVPHMLKPAATWRESHGPCVACHEQSHCRDCHYKDKQAAPEPFHHARTGQVLDADHEKLVCTQCHTTLRSKVQLTCGGAACHKSDPSIAYPLKRPGPVVTTQPSTKPAEATGPTKGVLR